MPRVSNPVAALGSFPRQTISVRFLFIFSFVIFGILWIESSIRDANSQYSEDDLIKEALENVATDFRYYESFRPHNKLPKYIKYILLWTPYDYAPFYFLEKGQRSFIKNNCSMINCYVTTDRNFFGGDVTKFDAIAFNGRNFASLKSDLPKERSPHQKYIYVNTESADNYPVCDEIYDDFFNWTSTYKLDSTIVNKLISIKDSNGEIVGPRRDMNWMDVVNIDEKLPYVHNKSKAVAWFVSNCDSRSRRETFVKRLQKALKHFGLTVDIYGVCGTLQCPKDQSTECYNMLEKDYYFYLALENSFDEDYITEKVLTAVYHDVVPIVYGGANYSRFLPPYSYLDGRRQPPERLAAEIANLINSKDKKLYQKFFWWKQHYSFANTKSDFICSVCSALHNSSLVNSSSAYTEFRKWWNPNFKIRC